MNWQEDRIMTPREFKLALKKLGMSQLGSGRYFDLGERQPRRYIKGEAKIPIPVILLLRSMMHHGDVPIVPKPEKPPQRA